VAVVVVQGPILLCHLDVLCTIQHDSTISSLDVSPTDVVTYRLILPPLFAILCIIVANCTVV